MEYGRWLGGPISIGSKPVYPSPTRQAALERLARVHATAYARTRNHLEGDATGLSPYLTHGVLTLPEVLAEVLKREPLALNHKLVQELGWREFFRHVWSHAGSGIFQSLHAGLLPDDHYAASVPADIREGRTGVPVIDQAVRTLYATGMLHNHARMWLASYVVHLRKVHWRTGADWLVAHLLDGDLVSNHLSWQWVSGTGSHKPYLFNAENVARFAPAPWHSSGTVVDASYEELDRIARGFSTPPTTQPDEPDKDSTSFEPPLHSKPPACLKLNAPDEEFTHHLGGRDVWLVHPWALRAPPTDLPSRVEIIGVYLKEHHEAWPWPEARWRWVDAAMAEVTERRWFLDSRTLERALAKARSVRAVDDPHIRHLLKPTAQLTPSPSLFASLEQICGSFSQWWTRATRGLKRAEDLL